MICYWRGSGGRGRRRFRGQGQRVDLDSKIDRRHMVTLCHVRRRVTLSVMTGGG